jgi:glycine cleavage system regulatory protein
MAQYVVNRVGRSRPEVFQPLAAVHARSGQWERATEVATRGAEVAEARGDADAAAALRRQVAAYRAREEAAITATAEAAPAEPDGEVVAPY